jgi:hypothetical protein
MVTRQSSRSNVAFTMNHPKTSSIRLPFSVPRPGRSTATAKICGMSVSFFVLQLDILTQTCCPLNSCRKRDSKYICPRCNIAYCSLECFRCQVSHRKSDSLTAERCQAHAQCSEGFYKETVRESIENDPRANLEERKAMIEMLKRFEEGQMDGEDRIEALDNDEDEDEDDELEKALAGVDLGQQTLTSVSGQADYPSR